MDSVYSLAIFINVTETNNFSETGRVLGISASAVGKCITRLEEKLEVRLFHRSTRNVSLTTEGELFLLRSRHILNELEEAKAELQGIKTSPKGKLRISIPEVNSLFLPVLTEFADTYPSILLEVNFTDRVVDIIKEGFDAVIRTGTPKDSQLSFRTVGCFKTMLVATPDYLMRYGEPQTPDELKSHKCILYRHSDSGKLQAWPVVGKNENAEPNVANMIICNNTESRFYFTMKNHGIAFLPDFLIADKLTEGTMKQVLPDIIEQEAFFYLLWPSTKYLSPKMRALVDFVCERRLLPLK